MTRMISTTCAVLIALTTVGAASLWAAGGGWSEQMTVGGFTVVNIQANANADGSDKATGTLRIPGSNDQKISLIRNPKGDVTGSTSLSARISAIDVQGSFNLTGDGLQGKGTVLTSPKPITDAQISIEPRGQASGSGRVALGGLNIASKFSISNGSLSISGSAPSQVQVDTPLAVYKFEGNIVLTSDAGKLGASAHGQVQRTGKLANQITNYSISDAAINLSDGKATINVGGVSVTFKFF